MHLSSIPSLFKQFACFPLLVCTFCSCSAGRLATLSDSLSEMCDHAERGAVALSPAESPQTIVGTGAILGGPQRLLVTTFHTSQSCPDCVMQSFVSEKKLRLHLLTQSPELDLAIFSYDSLPAGAQPLSLATSRDVRPLLACIPNSGGGHGGNLALGMVRMRPDQIETGQQSLGLLSVSADLHPGSSGSPVVSADGEVVGIVTRGIVGAGVAYALPAQEIIQFLNKIDPALGKE